MHLRNPSKRNHKKKKKSFRKKKEIIKKTKYYHESDASQIAVKTPAGHGTLASARLHLFTVAGCIKCYIPLKERFVPPDFATKKFNK